MATYGQQITATFKAGQDLSDKQYRVVKSSASVAKECLLADTAGTSSLGILQNDPKVGEEAVVCVFGFSKAYVNTEATASTITVGGHVQVCGSTGGVTGLGTVSASAWSVGEAFTAASSGSGQLIEILVRPTKIG